MSRFINPFPRYTDDSGNIISSGTLVFKDSGTNELKQTFSDPSLTISHPLTGVALSGGGVPPDIYFSGQAKVELYDVNGILIDLADPVSASTETGQFSSYSSTSTYNVNEIVRDSDDNYYKSIISNNINNDPSGSPTAWSKIAFIVNYNENETYNAGDIVEAGDGRLFRSEVNANQGNDPLIASSNWTEFSGVGATGATGAAGSGTSQPFLGCVLNGDDFSLSSGSRVINFSSFQVDTSDFHDHQNNDEIITIPSVLNDFWAVFTLELSVLYPQSEDFSFNSQIHRRTSPNSVAADIARGYSPIFEATGFPGQSPWAMILNSPPVRLSTGDIFEARVNLGHVLSQSPANFSFISWTMRIVNAPIGQSVNSVPSYSTSSRPSASTFDPGDAIWNTDDNARNYSDGTNWRDASGVIT